ncbi:hypothetical protein LSCM1_01490 [Leishmania martiniquensis]|uniref:Uncharacterized protein n=1 Tax=Leishmania martiniquensis TaxID=1580590 RepID=A0A836GT65_9TRYP|nr:hypothetical protein LSCM1_01490 [Leishmania martiniquensis]
MREYFLLVLFGVASALLCISCCIGCNVRRRQRLQAAGLNHGGYYAAERVGTQNAGGAAAAFGEPPRPAGGRYHDIYYQQYPQGGIGYYADTLPPGPANANYAEGYPPRDTRQPVSATVLFAAPPGTQAGSVNYAQYFPEARVSEATGPQNGACDGAAAVNTGTASRSEAVSPYGEADYVPRAADASSRTSRSDPPPPQYQTQPPLHPR